MTKLKRLIAVALTIIMGVSIWSGSITATAKETVNKVYGPQNMEGAKLTKRDIPDALVENGNFAEIIEDNYVKRLYNEEKDMNTLMFENANGERTMYLFKKAVKYEDENGNVVDKDISFKKYDASYKSTFGDAYVCDNGNNDIKIYMPEDISDGVKFVTDNKGIEMRAKGDGSTDKVTVTDDSVVYDEVFGENTSLIYKPLLDGIKEEIVLDEYTGQTEYKFRIKLDGYKLVTLDDNCLYLENVDNGEIEGIIDSVYMIDANGVTDFNNYYTYKQVKKNEYEITAHVNEEFLEAETTEYPVVIDPTVTIQKSNSSAGIYDATLNSTSTTEGGSGSLFVGNRSNTENGLSRVAMKFPGLNFTTLKVSVVKSASVYIRDLICESSALTIDCYQVLGGSQTWNESNVNWNLMEMGGTNLYNDYNKALSSHTVSYSNGLNQDTYHFYEFDITSAVFNWRAGDTAAMGRGIVFKARSESSIIHKTFGSYNRASYNPVFKMSYVPYGGGYALTDFLRQYKDYYGNSLVWAPNCIGFALRTSEWINFNTLGITSSVDKLNPIKVAKEIVNYATTVRFNNIVKAEYLKCGLDDSTLFDLNEYQYLIGVRVGVGNNKAYDLHAVAQMKNGQWINKHGLKNNYELLGYINPDDNEAICWKSVEYKDTDSSNDEQGYWYYSQTAYIKITIDPTK